MDVKEMLTSKNITVISCKMLKKTETRQQTYAVFRVAVSGADEDNVFDNSVWPVGADVRDWRFTSAQAYVSGFSKLPLLESFTLPMLR